MKILACAASTNGLVEAVERVARSRGRSLGELQTARLVSAADLARLNVLQGAELRALNTLLAQAGLRLALVDADEQAGQESPAFGVYP